MIYCPRCRSISEFHLSKPIKPFTNHDNCTGTTDDTITLANFLLRLNVSFFPSHDDTTERFRLCLRATNPKTRVIYKLNSNVQLEKTCIEFFGLEYTHRDTKEYTGAWIWFVCTATVLRPFSSFSFCAGINTYIMSVIYNGMQYGLNRLPILWSLCNNEISTYMVLIMIDIRFLIFFPYNFSQCDFLDKFRYFYIAIL